MSLYHTPYISLLSFAFSPFLRYHNIHMTLSRDQVDHPLLADMFHTSLAQYKLHPQRHVLTHHIRYLHKTHTHYLLQDHITVIMISHDIAVALQYASHILYLGKEVFFGPTEECLKKEYFRNLLETKGGNQE